MATCPVPVLDMGTCLVPVLDMATCGTCVRYGYLSGTCVRYALLIPEIICCSFKEKKMQAPNNAGSKYS